MRTLDVHDLGLIDYDSALALQVRLLHALKAGRGHDSLLLLEHRRTITLGRGSDRANLHRAPEDLERLGFTVREASRGGDVTYHGPGQLVAYPILRLREGERDVRGYLRRLESVIIRACARFGIEAGIRPGATGVWVGPRKLASIGVAISRWVTYHGIALNVDTDMSGFGVITPCGLSGVRMTSLSQLADPAPSMQEARAVFVEEFAKEFECRPAEIHVGTRVGAGSFPPWIRKRIPLGSIGGSVESLLKEKSLATVCTSAHCPNKFECYARGRATFMILGSVCTRRCRFCAVGSGTAAPPEEDEPERVSEAALRMGLKHAVVTSVTRDDLPDGGALQFARTVTLIKAKAECTVEVLTPDFQGSEEALGAVLDSGPDVFNHNVETVPRLYGSVRPQADYRRSLGVIRRAASTGAGRVVKSGIMVGLGETPDEVLRVLRDLRSAGCAVLTIGQYLRPSKTQLPVDRFVSPDEFAYYKAEGLSLGFAAVASGPFVRSSYCAEEVFLDSVDKCGGSANADRSETARSER